MDYTATGMLYLRTSDEIDGEKTAEYQSHLKEAKDLIDSCVRGVAYILRGSHLLDGDMQNVQRLFKVMPEWRQMEKPVEYLQGYSATLDSLIEGKEPEEGSKKQLVDFLDDVGARYIHWDIANSRNCCN